jgi:hypothetical protein
MGIRGALHNPQQQAVLPSIVYMNKQADLREVWMVIYEHEISFQIFPCDGKPNLFYHLFSLQGTE